MDPVVTDPQPREARMLAAIVFTDVVGFSKLAKVNEARVYVALQRDMGVMTNLCRAHGGQVLNTMGDGMLLCFASAVDAMSCAVEIQRTLYNQSHSLPTMEVLHHRIGVHLGDVIMNGDNVFGDGVNVASRLQSLAKPDSICFSSTVHEIIQNKLKIDAKYLGPRQLKNLGEPVRVWLIPPLGDNRAPLGSSDEIAGPVATETITGARGAKAALLVLASIALVGVLIFAFTKLKMPAHTLPDRPSKPKPVATNLDPPTETPGSGPAEVDPAVVRKTVDDLKRNYDFSGIVAELDKNGSAVPDLSEKRSTYIALASMKLFIDQQMSRTSAGTTVPVHVDQVGQAEAYLSNGTLYIHPDGREVLPVSPPIPPEVYVAIVSALVNRPIDGSTAPAEGANWVQLFSNEYGVAVPSSGT